MSPRSPHEPETSVLGMILDSFTPPLARLAQSAAVAPNVSPMAQINEAYSSPLVFPAIDGLEFPRRSEPRHALAAEAGE